MDSWLAKLGGGGILKYLSPERTENISLRKTVGKVSPIPVTLTSRNYSNFDSSNVSLKENKPDGVNPNSDHIDYYVRKNERKILWFSEDRIHTGCPKKVSDF